MSQTARAGKGGKTWSIVAHNESEWVQCVNGKMRGGVMGDNSDDDKVNVTHGEASIECVLAKGFGGKGSEYKVHATEVQLAFEGYFCGAKRALLRILEYI
ncbi:hypothetical protein BDR04DRAFT_1110456 [Suillus decipiens]|nr:hypothetical protein BDR04DRAFT_1110456 [Suillus decipiens]